MIIRLDILTLQHHYDFETGNAARATILSYIECPITAAIVSDTRLSHATAYGAKLCCCAT